MDFHKISAQKTEPQTLRPAPASLSFYPAEKKVSVKCHDIVNKKKCHDIVNRSMTIE
jgi:hypothetical protein